MRLFEAQDRDLKALEPRQVRGPVSPSVSVCRSIKPYIYFCLTVTPAQRILHVKYAVNNFVKFNQHSPIAYTMQGTVLGTVGKKKKKKFLAHIQ